MEMELEPRVKPLPYKVKAMSRESPSQKATHVLDSDLRNHWSTGTNTKEWIVLELDEACLLSHIRIYNKSVLEWEITVGLRYKPEAFIKVRPRCEAPRRDMMYPMNYTPCRYVRISCLRGNPIAIFFIQLIGVSVTGLEPEFQPVVNYLLPHIMSHKQDAHDMHLQLLQDVTNRLLVFLPQLETDLSSFSEAADFNLRFLAMLAGPYFPILRLVSEREAARTSSSSPDSDALKNNQTSITVSSNFEVQPRRSRSPSPFVQPASSSIAFRPDVVFTLLRKAYKDSQLGIICRIASRALQKLIEPIVSTEELMPNCESASSITDEIAKPNALSHVHLADYSSLFGEEFRIPDDQWDAVYMNLLDIAAVEEGILHVLYACASQPHLCCKLADSHSDFWSILPLVQALLPALRPPVGSPPDQVDDSLLQWRHPLVIQALSQIVSMSSLSVYRPLLRASAGYFSSFIPSHAKAACVLIDLCSGPLAPWMSAVIAKVDLAIELLEDLLCTIQGTRQSIARARAALKYIILALSGHMDDILAKYKEVKHKLLFLLEMLEPFLDPAITAMKSTIAFGDVSTIFLEKQEHTCALALNVIRTAVWRPAVLPSLESEWRRGAVAPSVLLSILGPHMPLPPEIDLCKCSVTKVIEQESSPVASGSLVNHHGFSSKSSSPDEYDGKTDSLEASVKADVSEDANLLFAPPELKNTVLRSLPSLFEGSSPDKSGSDSHGGTEGKDMTEKILANQSPNSLILDFDSVEYFNLQSDYLQLVNLEDCDFRASEFRRLALDLHSQHELTPEGHDAAIDALLLAAECYVNPFFMMSFRTSSKLINQINSGSKILQNNDILDLQSVCQKSTNDLEAIAHLERKRDKTVLQILLQAAELDREYQKCLSQVEQYPYDHEDNGQGIKIFPQDVLFADAVTLVRQNQVLLCHFILQHLQNEQHNLHEILLQSLLFLLHSATELFCPAENVIDVILQSTEHLNRMLTSFYYQLKVGSTQLDPEKLHGVQRRWVLLQRLIMASSGTCDETDSTSNARNGFQYRSLVPPSSWIQRISKFSVSPFPLVRFLGWMAVSRFAKHYLKEQLFLASDLSQLTLLLSIFADELALVDNIVKQKVEALKLEQSGPKQFLQVDKESGFSDSSLCQESLRVIYPDLHKFFPNMKKHFGTFGETILEAVGLQLNSLPSSAIPDALCWLSGLSLSPFPELENDHLSHASTPDRLKGYAATNAKAIILYVLEAIVAEHMEAMLPEMPRVAQILLSLCRTSYCNVDFLVSVLRLLKPLISHALGKASDDEKLLIDESPCRNFEELCFEELFNSIRCRREHQDCSGEKIYQGSSMIFILGVFFPDLSFMRKREILQSLSLWADFTSSEPTSSFYDYLRAFQKNIDSCNVLLLQSLETFGINNPFQKPQFNIKSSHSPDESSTFHPGSSDNADHSSLPTLVTEEFQNPSDGIGLLNEKSHHLSAEEIEEISQGLEDLISKLNPAVELCWKLHFQLTEKLTVASAKCLMLARCLTSRSQSVTNMDRDSESGEICQSMSGDHFSEHWRNALEGLSATILTIQQNHWWHVASSMLDYIFRLPQLFSLDSVISNICSAVKNFCCHAPRISWRLQTDKWLLSLFMRGVGRLHGDEASLVDLFCAMLGHPEPEQRAVAFQHLGRLVGLDINDGIAKLSCTVRPNSVSSNAEISVHESIVAILVSSTWDRVATLASSDPSMFLRAQAMALLSGYIPFAERNQLQSFLVTADNILPGLGKCAYPTQEGPLTRVSLGLLASACLYSPAEDIVLMPECVWRNLEILGSSKTGLGGMENNVCQALCKLRIESDEAKGVLKEMLSSNSAAKNSDPNFKHTREAILQVLSSMSSIQSYFDVFSKKFDQEAQELEEAEIEMELLQKEKALQEISESSREETLPFPVISHHSKGSNRLQQIKEEIRALERSKLKEEVAARRQKKLLVRHSRQKFLEEAALREMELLQELDRERTSEVEREIERQQLLELERAKTRELRYNLDLERERQTQRELQRELEQAESGHRPSRREFSSNPSSRPRERYRERENGRSGHEGTLRSSSRGREGATTQSGTSGPSLVSSVPTVVLAGSRSFSGQLPTILQSRDRLDERSTGYEDNLEGSRDSGDASSVGDPELGSTFDGLSGGFGSASRQGSRGSKSRQIVERRERDGRREGKWERKHS